MKIAIATGHTYPPQRVGGAESSAHGICLALRQHGFEVAVFSRWSYRQPAMASYLLAQLSRPDRRLVCDQPFGYPVYRARDLRAAVAELVDTARPDVVIVNPSRQMELAALFTALGVPTIVYIRDDDWRRLGGPVYLHPAVRYVTTSRVLAEHFAVAYGILPVCIPPIVQPELYRVDSARKNVTFVSPVASKGTDIALGLAACRPDIPFVFVEGWPMSRASRTQLDKEIRRHDNIVLRDPTHDMRTIYRETRLVLVPSRRFEGWGRVASEAQVSGIPALASNIGGLAEAVGSGGLLVDPEASISLWAKALAQIWDDPQTYAHLSSLALAHAQRPEFEPANLVTRLIDVIAELT